MLVRVLRQPGALLVGEEDVVGNQVDAFSSERRQDVGPKRIAEGVVFIKEGDAKDTGYMVLVLDGEVTVENIVVSRTSQVTINVLGAGSLVGEMGLVDGEPRSATCTATTDLRCAILTRAALGEIGRAHV